MRIVYVLTTLGVGGAERQVLALASRMAASGHTVHLLVLKPPPTQLASQWSATVPVTFLNLRKTPAGLLRGLVLGRRFVREFQPEIVHSHTFPANLLARLLRLVASWPVLISTIHNVYEGGPQRVWAYRLTDALADRVTAVSMAAAGAFSRQKAVRPSKLSVLVNGIDAARFHPDPARRAALRAEQRVGDSFVWFTAGRLVPAKDHANLLRAFALVHAQHSGSCLWIAGEEADSRRGRPKTGSPAWHASRLRRLTSELGLEQAVLWLGLRHDLPALLDAADAFVLSSAWEGMPLVVGEAMSMEKPVVATDVGGVRELLADTGALVPAKDPQALAQAMLTLMRQPATARGTQGAAARARILAHFSMDAKADEWQGLYAGLLESKQP